MSHYEERLERDLAAIRDMIRSVGDSVQEAVANSVRALVANDEALAADTILGDGAINRATRECDRMCHAFVIRHLPSAGHLRFVSSALRINVGLERIGDYARTVAREVIMLSRKTPEVVLRDVEALTRTANHMLDHAVAAFVDEDVELARRTMRVDDELESTFQRVFDHLIQAGDEDRLSTKDLFAYLGIMHSLERVGGQAKNICEEAVFTATGETKDPKVYRILFLDRHGSHKSAMASSYARKAYPASGRYDVASWLPANEIEPAVLKFLDANGAPPPDPVPQLLDADRDRLAPYHVIVGLDEGARQQIAELPYHTVFVQWDLGDDPDGQDEAALAELYRSLTGPVGSLMEALRGSDAD